MGIRCFCRRGLGRRSRICVSHEFSICMPSLNVDARSSSEVSFFVFQKGFLLLKLHWLDMKVRLSTKVLDHIVARHPEVRAYAREIVEAVRGPDLVVKGLKGELKALRFYSALSIGSKYLVVVYREFDDEKVIITAYFTSNVARVKGEVVWRKLR